MATNNVIKNCEKCGKQFKTNMAEIRKGWGRFCSRECAISIRHKTFVSVMCHTCKKVFAVPIGKYNDRVKRGETPKYCSRKCYEKDPDQKSNRQKQAHEVFDNDTVKAKIKSTKQTGEYRERAKVNQKKNWIVNRFKIEDGIKKRNNSDEWKKHFESVRGSGNGNWKGGKRKERHVHMGRREYINWRNSVFERDNYTCQKCGNRNGKGVAVKLNAHHIKDWANHPDLRYEISNGITLCVSCHRLIHSKR